MSSRLYSLGWYFLLSAWACCGLLERSALAQGTHQPKRILGLAETNSAEILTNLNSLTTKQEGVNQLEDQLGLLRKLNERNSVEGQLSMPYVPHPSAPVSSKTLKELMDRRQNWGLTSEELGTAGTSESDAFSAFEGQKSGKSSLQQFYDALNNGKHQQGGFRNSSDFGKSEATFEETANLPAGLRDKADKLKDSVKQDPTSILGRARTQSSFDNFFGLDRPNSAAESITGPKNSMEVYVDQFKKVLDGPSSSTPTSVDPLLKSLLPDTAALRSAVIPSMDAFHSPRPQEAPAPTTTPGTVSEVPSATVAQDLNAAALNRWNSLYNPSKLEIPKVTPPAPPNFDFPRRHF